MAISSINIRLLDGSRASWVESGNRCYSPPGPMDYLPLEDCLKKNNIWSAITDLGGSGSGNDLEAIAYWLISFTAVALLGIIFHGFFIWLITMVKPS